MTDWVDPYPAREEAVRQLREQGRDAEATAILEVTFVWEPGYKSTEQWLALGTYLVRGRKSDEDW